MDNAHRRHALFSHILSIICCFIILFLGTGCGVYSKTPPVNPELMDAWSGPLLEDTDAKYIKVYVQPSQTSITLSMNDLSEDLRILLAEYEQSQENVDSSTHATNDGGKYIEELSVNIPHPGDYVLIIEKTNP
ncbi:MAG: hypothetical protein WC136_02285 [Sphaerochaeta sp.]|nr:hypothetical protein [Sphaerochaeta sp.]